jgi:hypothetical protein
LYDGSEEAVASLGLVQSSRLTGEETMRLPLVAGLVRRLGGGCRFAW